MKRITCVLAIIILAHGVGGCQRAPPRTGSATFRVVFSALSSSDVVVVEIIVTPPNSEPQIAASLVQTAEGWTGVIGKIPIGLNHFQANALNSANAIIFGGSVNATVTENQTTDVFLLLQQATGSPPFLNAPPVIGAVTASSNAVGPGDPVAVAVFATDPNGLALTYAWSANGGSFTRGGVSPTDSWVAPAMQGSYGITITVTNSESASSAVTITISDSTANQYGSTSITAGFNVWPTITALEATPNRVNVGQTTALTLTTTDVEGNPLTYQWSAASGACATGIFSSTTAQDPTWTAPSGAPASCVLTVVASDNVGGSTTGSITVQIGPPQMAEIAPLFTLAFQDTDHANPSQVVHMKVQASDPQASGMTFAWTFAPAEATAALGSPISTATTSSETFTVGLAESTYTVTVTVTDALNLAATYTFFVYVNATTGDAGMPDAGTRDAGGVATANTLESGLNGPADIAIDSTKVYITCAGSGTVNSFPLTGGAMTTLASGLAPSNGSSILGPASIAVYGGNVIFVIEGDVSPEGIYSVPSGGGGVVTLATGQNTASSLAANSTGVYWTNQNHGTPNCTGALEELATGSRTPTTLHSGDAFPGWVALDSAYVYWSVAGSVYGSCGNSGTPNSYIYRTPPGGAGSPTVLYGPEENGGGQPNAGPIAVDNTNLYFASGGTSPALNQMPSGGGTVKVLATGNVTAIAVSGTNVFWSNSTAATIETVPVGGGTVTTLYQGTVGVNSPSMLAANTTTVFWTDPGAGEVNSVAW